MERTATSSLNFLREVHATGNPGEATIFGVVHSVLPNKSNARRIVRVRGRMLVIKAKEALEFEELFRVTVAASDLPHAPLDGKLSLRVDVYQENMRRDLDCELLCDVLQKTGVIVNDRAIWRKHYERFIDKDDPRIEFNLWKEGD